MGAKGIRTKSGFIGVEKRGSTYRGYVWFNGIKKRSKPFATAIEASKIRDRMALKSYGEIAVLNWLPVDLTPFERGQYKACLDHFNSSPPCPEA